MFNVLKAEPSTVQYKWNACTLFYGCQSILWFITIWVLYTWFDWWCGRSRALSLDHHSLLIPDSVPIQSLVYHAFCSFVFSGSCAFEKCSILSFTSNKSAFLDPIHHCIYLCKALKLVNVVI